MKKYIVILTTAFALTTFAVTAFFYQQKKDSQIPATIAVKETQEDSLIRSHSPILGPVDAPVTIIEFLDPSCEACRAFASIVEEIREKYPQDVRIVLRYAPFHQGSDEAVGILEAARKQGLFEEVLGALFATQPEWAIHGAPNLNRAWEVAAAQGLDMDRAKADAKSAEVREILKQDMADIQTHNVRQTPTFFINGKHLLSVGSEKLRRLVDMEVQRSKGIEPAQTEPPLRKIEGKFVCMVDNKFMNRMQMPVEIEGKTYYGCSPKAVHNLRINSAYRTAADPVTGNKVDKAAAVLGVNEDGLVSYFESDESFARHSTNP